ncbi:MAG: hypothetical protein LBI54_10465 [Lachnospiraceae bacterium]|jgi:arsenate reductase-like glutaredoxin family protein|nr:hypothetical protein [Lachnospiraceae bacterium]
MANIFDELHDALNENVMSTIYEKVNEVLGAGNQLFAMEFPARPLNPRDFEYTIDDCYSKITKPYPVQEAEFLLSDELFDCSPIVQGSNGEKLSSVYTTVINNYVPKLESMANFVADQNDIREWLLSKSDSNAEDANSALSRLALCKDLYNKYLEMRNEWYKTKDEKYEACKRGDGGQNLDTYAKWLSSEGLVQEEILNNYYNDAIVKGHYHEVLTLLGYLNVASPAETLEITKQKMRSSLRRSLDGSSDVYPVNFQPSDWFKSLRPNINPKDLTMAKDQLVLEYRNKRQKLSALQNQLLEVSAIHIAPTEQEELKRAADEAEARVAAAESNMMQLYGASACNAFKAVLKIFNAYSNPVALAAASKEVVAALAAKETGGTAPLQNKSILDLLEGITAKAAEDMFKQQEGLQENLAALKAANEARTAYSEAKVKDMTLQKLKIEELIKNVQDDLDFLAPLVSGILNPEVAEQFNNNLLTGDNSGEDNDFTDIVITCEKKAEQSASATSASTSSTSWNVGGWFFSAARNKAKTQAEAKLATEDLACTLEIGFRIKKVAIDRGGWLNPTIFKLTNNFFHLTDIRVSGGLNKEQVQKAVSTNQGVVGGDVNRLVTYYSDKDTGKTNPLRYVLPAIPTGFVVAKDVTIKITSSSISSEAVKNSYEQSNATGGGLFCFKASHSSTTKGSNETSYHGSDANSFYMRIPGPQILGWFLQFTPPDLASEYKGIDTNVYKEISAKLNLQTGNPSANFEIPLGNS